MSQNISPLSDIEFSNIKNLQGKNTEISKIPLKPEVIKLENNKIIILDDGGRSYFKIYSYPDFTLEKEIGVKGEGPDEIAYLPVFTFTGDDIIEFFDFQKSALFNLDKNSKLTLVKVLPPELIESQFVIKLNDKMIFGSGAKGGRVYFLNIESGMINYLPYLEATSKLPDQYSNVFNDGISTCSPDKKTTIYTSKYFDYFDILNADGSIRYSRNNASIEGQKFLEDKQITSNNTKLYYSSVYATNKHIYLLSLGGKSYAELLNEINNDKFQCEIQQFDLQGNPLKCIILNTPVKAFCVDEKNNKIISINPLSEDFPLMEFTF